jgi:DNA-binding HxlR family transcriptional regulator
MKEIINFSTENCPVGYAFKAVEGKWKLPALWVLCKNGTLRYNELKKALGISNMVLTNTLRELEEFGLVNRIQYNEIPPRVEYSLTEVGMKLMPALREFGIWGDLLMQVNKKSNNRGV